MLNVEELLANARERAGADDLGDGAVLEGLSVLVDASNSEARLSQTGEQRWGGMIVSHLANRLRVVDYLKGHSELLERPVDAPMFVFGLPRTGTTLTINLLSADPARRCLLRWETIDPVPPAYAGELRTDRRAVAERERLEMLVKHAPQIAAIHYEDADGPTECQFAMAPSFRAQLFDSMANVPSYRRWLFEASTLPAFRFHKQLLQLLQAENAGRWTLKNPWHPLFLDDLVTVYPDAQLVMTHRDPVAVVGSACSLVRHVRPGFSDSVDLREVAEQSLVTFDLMIERQQAFREKHGEDAIHDIRYPELMRDPIGVMRRLYERFDEPFTAEAEAAMRAMLAVNPQGKHGKHVYTLEEFGLDADAIRTRYRDYSERFGVASPS